MLLELSFLQKLAYLFFNFIEAQFITKIDMFLIGFRFCKLINNQYF